MTIKNHLHNQQKWAHEVATICEIIRTGTKVQFTSHFWDSLKERDLTVGDVYAIFKNGSAEIIQGHAVGTYAIKGNKVNTDELRVFYGMTNNKKVIHVVMAMVGPNHFKFVTVYYPSPVFFETDMKTLKKEWAFKSVQPTAK